MGQFKPMVKMFTDEPSVILKLKKGGKVKSVDQGAGFKSMSHNAGASPFAAAEAGKAPKKPSMMARQKAMNPNLYAKGGSCAKVERELKQHEAKPASKAHGKASGGEIDAAATKTTIKGNASKFAKTKVNTTKRDTSKGPTGEVKEGKPGGYAMGGTIEGNEGPFEKTKMVTAGKGKTGGSTGGVRMGNAGGYKSGGKACYAEGGAIEKKMTRTTVEGGNWENRPANTAKPGVKNTTTGEVKKANGGGYKHGGKAKKMADGGIAAALQQALRGRSSPAMEMAGRNAASRLGAAMTPDTAGSMRRRPGGRPTMPVIRPKPEMSIMPVRPPVTTMPIRPPVMKKGGATKKAYATGGNVIDDGKAEKMPRRPVSRPVANSLQSGTFKRGGKVGKYNDGGKVPASVEGQLKTIEAERAYRNWEKEREKEMQEDKNLIPDTLKRVGAGIKKLFSPASAASAPGSVTKTEKSVTVAPGKKRGGKC